MTSIKFASLISLFQFPFFMLRIIRRVDVVELYRRLPVDLDYRPPGRCGVVVHAGVEVGEAGSAEAHQVAGVEFIFHAYFESPEMTVTFSRLGWV